MDKFYEINYAIFPFYNLFFFPFLTLMIIRRKQEPIQSRGWEVVILQSIAQYFSFFFLSVPTNYITCYPIIFTELSVLPLCLFPYFIRSWTLWFKFAHNQQVLKYKTMSDVGAPIFFQTKKRLASRKFQMCVFLGLFLFSLVIFLSMAFVVKLDQGTCNSVYFNAVIISEFVVCVVMIIIAIISLWRVQDSYYIKFELKTMLFVSCFFFSLWAMSTVLNFPPPFVPSLFSNLSMMFTLPATVIFPTMMSYKFQNLQIKEKNLIQSHESQISNEGDLFQLTFSNSVMMESFEK